jgi:hypothetical protein
LGSSAADLFACGPAVRNDGTPQHTRSERLFPHPQFHPVLTTAKGLRAAGRTASGPADAEVRGPKKRGSSGFRVGEFPVCRRCFSVTALLPALDLQGLSGVVRLALARSPAIGLNPLPTRHPEAPKNALLQSELVGPLFAKSDHEPRVGAAEHNLRRTPSRQSPAKRPPEVLELLSREPDRWATGALAASES